MVLKTFEELLEGFIKNELSKEELDCFLEMIKSREHEDQVKNAIESLLIDPPAVSPGQLRADALFNNIMNAAGKEVPAEPAEVIELKHRNHFRLLKFTVAASVLGLVLLGLIFLNHKKEAPALARTEMKNRPYKNDVLPGGEKAILKLGDGSTIVLDDAKNGALARQGNTQVIKINGKIEYNAIGVSGSVVYNTISTPRGGKYQVRLPDGRQVWLNSGASLYFPTAFVGKERRVELSGEAYIEVAKNKEIPFFVKVKESEVHVLGTHFDVMAYNDEGVVKTSLLEGSVRFVSKNHHSILKPGQQSQLVKNGEVKILDNINVEEVLSWKSGVFDFNGADVETVMRQLSRWYDVDVVYKAKPVERFFAKIPTNTRLSDVLMALELTGKVHFQIEGRKVIVAP